MWEYARYLAARGHTVSFVTSHFPGARSEELIDGIAVVRLGGVLTLWLHTFLHYMRRCRGHYDVVVTEGFGGSRIPRFAPLYVKEPIVTEWHQVHDALFANQYPRILVPLLNLLERLTAYVHRNTLVRAGTKDWQDAFPRIGFKRENVFLVPVSIREDWLDRTQSHRVAAPTILWLGKFRQYKCPHHVILALKAIVKEIPEAQLILAGRHDDGRYLEKLQRLVAELNLEAHVRFRIDVSEEEKRAILSGCRVLALPSSVEGFGIVALEANACGVPVVASSGVPEGAIRHDDNGLRYPFGDIAALATAVIQVLQDEVLHRRLSENGVKFAREFRWSKVGAQFEDILTHAVGKA